MLQASCNTSASPDADESLGHVAIVCAIGVNCVRTTAPTIMPITIDITVRLIPRAIIKNIYTNTKY